MITLTQTYSAIGPGLTASFAVSGGTGPYTFSVVEDGAGGSIDSSGLYTAPPSILDDSPNHAYDTILVRDSLNATTSAYILVGNVFALFCDIIQTSMGLPNGRVTMYDQKIFQPTDSDLYVIISIDSCKAFASINEYNGSGSDLVETQSVSMYAQLGIDIISRGPAARDQKELVMMALNSNYSVQQQEKNSFTIGRVSPNFTNLSQVDGAAIPYRFRTNCAIQYLVTQAKPIPYFSTFTDQFVPNP